VEPEIVSSLSQNPTVNIPLIMLRDAVTVGKFPLSAEQKLQEYQDILQHLEAIKYMMKLKIRQRRPNSDFLINLKFRNLER
jgi:hypothetical protein